MHPIDREIEFDMTDKRFLAFRNLRESRFLSEDDAIYLHRRISSKVDELQLDDSLRKAYMADVENHQKLLKVCKRLTSGAKEISDHYGFLRQLSPLDPVFAQSFERLEDSEIDVDLRKLKWEHFRERIYQDMQAVIGIATAAQQRLRETGGRRGQPPKETRDRYFAQWFEMVKSVLKASDDSCADLAMKSWNIYFPKQRVISHESSMEIATVQRRKRKLRE